MQRFLGGTRYLVVLPVLGLGIAASFFFIFGGIGLVKLLLELLVSVVGDLTGHGAEVDSGLVIVEVIESVHTFLVGTVLYVTAIGLYQLFIGKIESTPNWLKIDSTEELETALIGTTVVVLAINFMSAVFVGEVENLLEYGAGIALPIAALGFFIGLRAWTNKEDKELAVDEPGAD